MVKVARFKDYKTPRISSEFFDCSLPFQMDQYGYCGFSLGSQIGNQRGCQYCFSEYQRPINPSIKHTIKKGILTAVDVDRIKKLFLGHKPKDPYYKYFIKNKFILHWGSLSEPFCPIEKALGLGYKLIDFFGELNYPVIFSVKGADLLLTPKYLELFEKYKHQHNFAFQFSITGVNKAKSDLIEKGLPTAEKRFEAMKTLSDMGYYTGLRLRPFIIGYSDDKLDELLLKTYKSGAKAISLEFFCMTEIANEYVKERYNNISKAVGFDIFDFYKALSPHSRGSYLRLNRNAKEQFVKKIYKFAHEHKMLFVLSDPDFKEISDSFICCGLPDEFSDGYFWKNLSPDFHNYSKANFFYVLRYLRTKYYQGEIIKFSFKDLIALDKTGFLSTSEFIDCSLKKFDSFFMEASRALTLKDNLRLYWNNLNSPDNPFNYYQGALKPIAKDENGDLVYVYNPQEYEERWKKEGLI